MSCSLVWMFHGHQLNKRIKRLHEKVFQFTYDLMKLLRNLCKKTDPL